MPAASLAPAPPAARCSLADLELGGCGIVADLAAEPAVAERLRDLGFVPGTRVLVRGRAPLGDPRIYELRGTRFCLRRREAAGIQVIRQDTGPTP